MADLVNRDKLEADLARELAKTGGTQLRALVKELGDPPSLSNVSDDFWGKYGASLTSALNTWLTKVYLQQAEQMTKDAGIGVDWALVNKDAAEWASSYTFDLVKGITDNTRDSLQSIISGAITNSLPLADVREQIEPLFGPVRAEMIATTEITRASSEGEAATVDRLAEQGIQMRATWLTREDEKVCPICGSLDGTQADDNGVFTSEDGDDYDMPPAHPNCRCSLAWEIVTDG
jgi:SPP1 gp7 family putative phage head morphogenesis protein